MWKNGEKPFTYLAGAIENAPDSGSHWREEISLYLQHELDHLVFNPCLEESHILTPEEFQHFRRWKTTDLKRFRKTLHKIISTDLHTLINKVDYIICLWDHYVLQGGGTQGELTMAFWYKIPVYMVSTIPLEKLSSWIIGCTTEIFEDFESLKKFLGKTYL